MAAPARRFVSRGGVKLAAALERLAIEVAGKTALDAGCSTGGFTDALLQAGAARVLAVDVAYGQLDWTLRNDERVVVLERTNVRGLTADALGERVGLVVADLAFIDLRKVADAFGEVAAADAEAALLVKPQFELPKAQVPRGGIVVEPAAWRHALGLVADAYRERGWRLVGACASPITGPKGNREFFVHLDRRDAADAGDGVLDAAVAEAP